MQQIRDGHPVKLAGVLEHGHGMSPFVSNHFIVDNFFFSKVLTCD